MWHAGKRHNYQATVSSKLDVEFGSNARRAAVGETTTYDPGNARPLLSGGASFASLASVARAVALKKPRAAPQERQGAKYTSPRSPGRLGLLERVLGRYFSRGYACPHNTWRSAAGDGSTGRRAWKVLV